MKENQNKQDLTFKDETGPMTDFDVRAWNQSKFNEAFGGSIPLHMFMDGYESYISNAKYPMLNAVQYMKRCIVAETVIDKLLLDVMITNLIHSNVYLPDNVFYILNHLKVVFKDYKDILVSLAFRPNGIFVTLYFQELECHTVAGYWKDSVVLFPNFHALCPRPYFRERGTTRKSICRTNMTIKLDSVIFLEEEK